MTIGKPIRVGIIGQGRSGYRNHALVLAGMPELYEIAAVSDPQEAYRARAVQQFGCDAYADYQDMLRRDDIDLIVNASPSHLHVPLSLAALEAGKHVLCEKPLARTAVEVDQLIAASERAGKYLATFQQARLAPAFRKITDIVQSGVLGRIVHVRIAYNNFARRWDWQTLQANNGGSLLNTGPHPLDQALRLFGSEDMPDVFCKLDRVNTFGDADDYVKLLLSKPGHPMIDLEISSCDAYPQDTYHIHAEFGGISGDYRALKWRYYDREQAPKQQLIRQPLMDANGEPTHCKETLVWTEESWSIADEKVNPPLQRVFYEQLFDTIANGAPLVVTPQQIRQQIAIIEECHRQNPLPQFQS